MPKNWEARQAKVEKRRTRIPKHGYKATQTIAQEIVKRGKRAGTVPAYREEGR